MKKPDLKKLFTVSVLALLLVSMFVGVWQIKPVKATTIFSDDFESGDFSAWTASTGTPEVVTTYAHHGSYSCNINAQEGPYKDLAGNYSILWRRVYVYFTALPTSDGYRMGIIAIGNPTYWSYPMLVEAYRTAGVTHFSLFNKYLGTRVDTDVVVGTGQ